MTPLALSIFSPRRHNRIWKSRNKLKPNLLVQSTKSFKVKRNTGNVAEETLHSQMLSCLEALSKTVSDLSLPPSEYENYRAQGFESFHVV